VNVPPVAPVRAARFLAWIGALAIALPFLSLTPYMAEGTELARVRNALIFDWTAPQDFNWTPANRPPDFLVDLEPASPQFEEIVQRLRLQQLPSDWERARALAGHLLGSHAPLIGGGVQSNLSTTYEAIVGAGRGYCADFVLVFRALSGAAGIPVRAWAFSFDGFGGYGHVLPEVWDRQAQRWLVLDVFNNNYFVRLGRSEPLSGLALRQMLLQEPDMIELRRIDPSLRPGYEEDAKALAYYRRGRDEWYLWWGSNPFTFEGGWPYRWLLLFSRPIAQLTAIADGVHPRIRPVLSASNLPQIRDMERLRLHLKVATVSGFVGFLCLVWGAVLMYGAASIQRKWMGFFNVR
jgi:hypothetical protein